VFFVTAAALAIVLMCIGASTKRLWYATNPTSLDAGQLVKELAGDKGRGRYEDVCRAIAETPDAEWERDLVEALGERGEARTARINEQLAEFDYRLQRWARVPRVCASISSSAGFLLAAMAMRIGLGRIDMASDDALHEALNDAALDALGVAAVGMWGTIACIAIQARARRAARDRLDATDKLVERLEALAAD
jgi:hypothetical protein